MEPARKQEIAEWGETALRQLRGPVLGDVRKRIARWRDPRARLLRRRRRAKQAAVGSAATSGVLGAGSVVSFSPYLLSIPVEPGFTESMLDLGGFGLVGLAVATAAGAVGETVRYRRLRRVPLPPPAPEPVELPPHKSAARESMRRLGEAEQSLHGALAQLSESGAGGDAAGDARTTADSAAAELRRVAARLMAVEAAIPHAPAAEREELQADVVRLRRELEEGVEGYGSLVAAAGRAVAASSAPEQKHLMQDATDRLAGLAMALHELSQGKTGHTPESGQLP